MSNRVSQPAVFPSRLTCSEHTVRMRDGVDLFYRAWLPDTPAHRAVILFHRGHEHSGRFEDLVEGLGLSDTAFFAWDARGHGRSPGERGHAPSFAWLVEDLDEFVRFLSRVHSIPQENIIVVGLSIGAVAVAAWVHDYAPRIRAMVLVTPALRIKLYVPLAIPGLRLLHKLRGGRAFVTSYVKSRMLTHDEREAERYDADPLIGRSIAVNILLGLHDASTRLMADAGAVRAPTLLLTTGRADWVVRFDAQRKFFERLGSPTKTMRVFEGMRHDILHEADRRLVFDPLRRFVVEQFDAQPVPEPLLEADRQGETFEEFERLRRPLPSLSLQRAVFTAQRLVLKTLGRLSEGIRLGWRAGFDSGSSLDYVYENRARGSLIIGKWFDRLYLQSPGWRGVRQRKANLESMLLKAVECTRESGRPVRLLDVASGSGRYVLETVRSLPRGTVESALLRDKSPASVEAGKKLAADLGVEGVTFETGDAFDESSLGRIDPSPTVAIVSGLYELFPHNEPVMASLRGLARAMRRGGYLIYTGQPWHPQLEMIARVLVNRDGEPWIMRRRTQLELDDLVAAAGFEKIETAVDEQGIFTVSLARIGEAA